MYQGKIDEIFKELPNVFGIANDILVVGFDDDGGDHEKHTPMSATNRTKVNLKLNKDKCHLRCSSVLFFGKIISRHGGETWSRKTKSTE